MKKPLPKITEPSEGLVHYAGSPLSGYMTLCGITDYLLSKQKHGQHTNAPVTCEACLEVVRYVHSFARPQGI